MSFLLGAFGARCTPIFNKKLSLLAQQVVADGMLTTVACEKGIVFAGQRADDQWHRDVVMPFAAGVILGKVFDKTTHEPATLDDALIHAFLRDPKNITKQVWGRYVGVVFDKQKQTITLLRDPQGLLTLFYSVTADGIVFATDLKLLYEALEIKPSLDMIYFAEHLIHTNHALPTTPFKDIQELLPGMGLTITVNGVWSQELLWDVASIKSSFITDEQACEEELLATLKSCVKAWTTDASGVCVELSGGTDSSGVMLLLRDVLPADKTLTAINFIDSKTPSSNEIEYAQEIADTCNASLHFIDWQTASLFDPLPHNWFPNRPSTFMLFYSVRQQIHQHAERYNCSEIMNGQGGDHVFLAPQPKNALADYWLDRGLCGITGPLREISGIYRAPVTLLSYNTVKAVMHYYRGIKHEESDPVLCLDKQFVNALEQHEFYLSHMLKHFYPAKATQIESLCHAISYCERNQFPVTITHPLLSQPIVELGLKIPTYQSFADGYDRIFFRRAIDKAKKTKSLWRRIKGQTTSSMAKSCAFHAREIRDIVSNGRLVNSGMIDKQWLEIELGKMKHGHVENLWPILHLLTSELWINKWNL